MYKRILVTGGAGFIGSSFIRYGLQKIASCEKIVNLDLLTYAANLDNLTEVASDPRYHFVHGDIRDERLVAELLEEHAIDAIVHFAAETHVDRSISGPRAFYETNVGGTVALLEVVRRFPKVHFHHISTDEVYGSLGHAGQFSETSPYRPNSPYAASKAASDHFVRAYAHTYGLSTTLSHCTNNYGPCQHVEKFIPQMITGALLKRALPLYGTGENVRDWIFVEDHSEAVWMILEKAKPGAVYDIGGGCEMRNIDLLHTLLREMGCSSDLITLVPDRPGHDLRYAIDTRKIRQELGWVPRHDFTAGLQKTIAWYTDHARK
ncbi:MAG: dTDP-glucose 4,6-dehydratase [Verrucomicrobia bacterium]|nr:dTDP-glucose 4,6-dehydratase [Verrucomicrobiota bacterium]